jgi:hypothetical protein
MRLLGLPRMSGGLIAEQTGSEVVQKVLLRGPETQTIKIMVELFSNPKALAAAMKTIQTKKDLDGAMSVLEKAFAPLARQVGRRMPLVTRSATEEEEYVPPAQPLQQPVLPPPQGALNPPPPTPTRSSGPAPSPVQQQPAAVQSVSQGSGPVDRARFADLFPEDRELLGIGSLRGGRESGGIGSLA